MFVCYCPFVRQLWLYIYSIASLGLKTHICHVFRISYYIFFFHKKIIIHNHEHFIKNLLNIKKILLTCQINLGPESHLSTVLKNVQYDLFKLIIWDVSEFKRLSIGYIETLSERRMLYVWLENRIIVERNLQWILTTFFFPIIRNLFIWFIIS